MLDLNPVQIFSVWVVPVLLGITVHEVAHGWVASLLGDKTALMLGRLTLNPLKHVDPMGTIIIPGLLLLLRFRHWGAMLATPHKAPAMSGD